MKKNGIDDPLIPRILTGAALCLAAVGWHRRTIKE